MRNYILILAILIASGCNTDSSQSKKEITSHRGVVSAASPEAADAGTQILDAGGNAIDAAIAVQFALAVTEPAMSGLGGGTQVIFSLPGQKPISINGASISPSLTPVDATESDLSYHRRSTIPSTVKVMGYIYDKYGSGNVTWEELLTPAIEYARNGFPMGNFRHKVYRLYQQELTENPFNTRFFMMPDGTIPSPGDTLKQTTLANTLDRIAKFGPEEFYTGQIAEEIADDMRENGGWITLKDLNDFPDPIELEPVHINFRDYEVYSQPPPCGGWTALLILNILENTPKDQLQPGTQSRFENLLSAIHLAHQDRKENPLEDLLDLPEKLNKDYARKLLDEFNSLASVHSSEDNNGETTHYSVVDKDGMAVAVTSSINAYFGARAATSSLGFLYNTYMDDFILGQPDHPFAIGPGKMNYSSMSPTIVQQEGKSVLVIGSPGSARIISSVSQLIQLWVDSELSIEEIVAMPRLHSVNGKIYCEDMDTSPEWLNSFRQKGFEVAHPSYSLAGDHLNAYFGGIHAISLENGQWTGTSDPRRDGKTGYSNK